MNQKCTNGMLQVLAWASCVFMLVGGFPRRGQAAQPLDLRDLRVVERAMLDDAAPAVDFLREQVKRLNPEQDPIPWVRAVWVIGWVDGYISNFGRDGVVRAEALAFQHQLLIEWVSLRSVLIESQDESPHGFSAAVEDYRKLIQQTRQTQDPMALAHALANFAHYLNFHNQLSEALPVVKEANQIVDQFPDRSLTVFDNVKNGFALSLRYQGQMEAALSVYRDIDRFAQKEQLRNSRAFNLYDMTIAYLEHDKELRNADQYEAHFQEAIRLAREIKSGEIEAMSYYGWSTLKSRLKLHGPSLEFLKIAQRYFAESGDREWQSRIYKRLAEDYVATGRYQDALVEVDNSLRTASLANKRRINELEEYRFQALMGLGQWQAAAQSMQAFIKGYQELAKEREEKEYNRAAVQLGLQFEEERNRTLEKENQVLHRFRLVSILAGGLTLLVALALGMVWRQSREIRRSRHKMKLVLDNIDEGIMVINRKLEVMSGHSPYLEKILGGQGQTLEHRSVLDLLYPGNAMHQDCIMIRETLLTCLGEQVLTWELNSSHLPREVEKGEQVLQLHWQALQDRQGLINSYLISVRDVTEVKTLVRTAQAEAERMQGLQQKLEEVLRGNPSSIRALMTRLDEGFRSMESAIFQENKVIPSLRQLHGWKGSARTLGMKSLATALHQMESCLDAETGQIKDRDHAAGQWQALKLIFREYDHVLNSMVISRRHDEQGPLDLYGYSAVYARELGEGLRSAGLAVNGLMLWDDVNDWQPESLARIHEALIHAVANVVDHGFVRPSRRGRKLEPALLRIHGFCHGDMVSLTVRDNGAGLDWAGLQKRAEALGLSGLNRSELAEQLFGDGVSTADKVTERSGRGLGLSAIQAICQDMGGSVSLSDAEGGGTLLTMNWPAHSVRLSLQNPRRRQQR